MGGVAVIVHNLHDLMEKGSELPMTYGDYRGDQMFKLLLPFFIV